MALLQGYKFGTGASFVTLTYNQDFLPIVERDGSIYGTLRKKDLNLFWQKVRKVFRNRGSYVPQFVACGEYGEEENRPHMHLLVFGSNSNEFNSIAKSCWQSKGKYKGIIDVKPLRSGGIRYVIDYIMKEDNTAFIEKFDNLGLERPFLRHSVRLGLDYFFKYFEYDPADFTYIRNGKRSVIPATYRKRLPGGAQFQYEDTKGIVNSYVEGMPYDVYSAEQSYKNAELDIFYRRQKGKPAESITHLKNYLTSCVGYFREKQARAKEVQAQFKEVGLPIERAYYTRERLDLLSKDAQQYIISVLKYLE